jgi:hypothetical protein
MHRTPSAAPHRPGDRTERQCERKRVHEQPDALRRSRWSVTGVDAGEAREGKPRKAPEERCPEEIGAATQ